MATAFQDDSREDVTFTPHAIDTRLLFRGDQYEIQDNPDLVPEFIVVREIDMAPPGSAYPFVFKRPDRRYKYSPQTLEGIVQDLLDGAYEPNGWVNQYYRPLDVKLSAPTCFVFHLSDRWSWRFSTKQDGVSLGESDAAVQQRYANVRHFIDTVGSGTHYEHGDLCRILCFTAVPELNAQQEVVPFHHQFNLIVEFVYPDGEGNEKINVIPVIIDPDVRHPGGSGE